jgi:hypothetical protein
MTTSARTTTPFFALARCLAWLAALLPAAALGAPPPGAPVVQIVELYEPDIDPRAQALTNALRDVVFDAGEFDLNTRTNLLLQLAVEAKCDTKAFGPELAEASDRGMTKPCLERIGKRIGAKAFFWGFLFKGEGGRGMVKLHLWQKGEDRAVALPYDDNRRRLAERLYRHLTQPGKVGDVRLVAEGGARRGELVVNGRPAGPFEGADVELTVPVGELVAEVRSGDKLLAQGRGQVAASGLATVRLEPVAEPTPPPETPRFDLAPGAGATRSTEGPSNTWQRPVGWTGVAAGAALIGVGVFGTLRASGLKDDFSSDRELAPYVSGLRQGADACDAADRNVASELAGAARPEDVRDHCSSLAFARTLRPIGFVGGGLLAVGGAVLLLTAPSSSPPPASGDVRWRFAPALGRSTAGGTLDLTW